MNINTDYASAISRIIPGTFAPDIGANAVRTEPIPSNSPDAMLGASGIGAANASGIGAANASGIGAANASGIGGANASGVGAANASGVGASSISGVGDTSSVAGSAPVSFRDTLKNYLEGVNNKMVSADQATQDLATGKTNDINKVVTSVEEANLTMDFAVAMQNKLLSAYQQISEMQM